MKFSFNPKRTDIIRVVDYGCHKIKYLKSLERNLEEVALKHFIKRNNYFTLL